MRISHPATVHRYGNGLTVLIREEQKHPVASIQFWVRSGSCHEGAHLGSGLSHLLEHMVFKGTEQYSGQELAQTVQQMGGMWNAYTSNNRTVYYIEGPAKSSESFLEILTQLVFHPTFPEKELEKEKEVIRREMAMYDDDPDAVAGRLLMETLYKKHPRRYPVLGELDSFNLLNRDDMVNYHSERYCCNNVFVIVTGNVKAKEVIEKLGALTKDLSPGQLLNPTSDSESKQWGNRVVRKEFPLPYSKLMLAWRVPRQNHIDSPALIALSHILSSGRSAKLYSKFHDNLGIVHNISASINQSANEEGVFIISADVDRDKRDLVKDMIFQELQELGKTDLNKDLSRSIKKAKAARIKSMATVSGLADETANQWFHFGNTEYYSEWLEALERVNVDDLHHVIRHYLTAECITEVTLDPLDSNSNEQEEQEHSESEELDEYTLNNGLRVILRKDNSLPMVYGCMAFKGGSPYETEQTAGITSMLSECLLKGTSSRNANDIAEAFENLGGGINSTSGNNSMSIGFNCLSEDITSSLNVLADIILNPSLPQEAFEHEKQAMISDAKEQLEDPVSVAFDNLKTTAYGNASYGLSTYGAVDNLPQITRDQLVDHYRKLICAQNAVLTVAGAFNEKDILASIKQFFENMESGSTPQAETTRDLSAGTITATLDKEQSVFALSMPGVSVFSKDRLHAMLFHAWCSDMAGPIFTGIREEEGLAYFASSSLFIGLDAGMIIFYLGTSHALLNQAQDKLNNILNHIHHHGMSEEELERTRSSALSSVLLSQQSNATLSQKIALDVLYGYPADFFNQQADLIEQISLDDINTFIKTYLDPAKPRVISIVKNPV